MKRYIPLFLIVCLVGIFHARHLFIYPYNAYEWRQWDTFAVIRTYREEGMHFLSPRTNQIYAPTRDVSERLFLLEFPLYSYAVAILTYVFGISFFPGRLLNIALAIGASLCMYAYVKKQGFTTYVSMLSVLFLNLSPVFQFSATSIQPDMLMMFFLILTFYILTAATPKYKPYGWMPLALCTLIKPYSYIIIFPILLYTIGTSKHRARYIGYLLLPPVFYLLWVSIHWHTQSMTYWHGRQIWSLIYPNTWHFNLIDIAASTTSDLLVKVVTLPLLFLSIVGLVFIKNPAQRTIQLLFISGFFLYCIIFLPGNYKHLYYQLPILLSSSFLSSIGFSRIIGWVTRERSIIHSPSSLFILCATGIGVVLYTFSLLSVYPELFTQHAIYEALGPWPFTQTIIPKSKTVFLYHREESPVILNMMDRNGWIASDDHITCGWEKQRLTRLKPDFIIIYKLYHDKPKDMNIAKDAELQKCLTDLPITSVYETPYLSIYAIKNI